MNKPDIITNDPRVIQHIYPHEGWGYKVGRDGITRIEAYDEHGNGAFVPWFAVYKGDEMVMRVNAAYISGVVYEDGGAK
jgi:hypothetical protein